MSRQLKAYIKLLRPHQYLKNGFVFLGVLFSQQWGIASLSNAMIVFLAFCCMASAVYIINDLIDVEADRSHPLKRERPIANGQISTAKANALCVVLVLLALSLAFSVSQLAVLFLITYLAINAAYSWVFKHVVILDVFLISSGFMLRILAGTLGLGIQPSEWLLLCGLMVTLFLGFTKRRAELQILAAENERATSRQVLNQYSPQMLEQYISITAACTVLTYGLYTVSPQTIAIHGNSNLIYTLPFVVYGIFRYLFLLHRKARGNDTAHDLIQDPHLLITVIAWLATTLLVLW